MNQVHLQPAFVLHSRAYRNTSLLIDILSPDYGYLRLVARGARNNNRSLQPFRLLTLSWRGKGELKTLTGTEEAELISLTGAKIMACGFYLNELLIRLLPRDVPQKYLFASYHETLRRIADQRDIDICLRIFERDLLFALGYGLNLEFEVFADQPLADNSLYRYIPEQGAVPSTAKGAEGVEISGACLHALKNGKIDCLPCRRQIKNLMRTILKHYLGSKPLKSRELLDEINKQAKT